MTKLIAEIGINYAYGSDRNAFLDNAKLLIAQAALAGFDYVKFQKRTPEDCVPEDQASKEKIVPWRNEPTTYLQYKKDIELTREEYIELIDFAHSYKVGLFASVWDKKSVDLMDILLYSYDMPSIMKIPSALITDLELCKYARKKCKTLMISTGMSTEVEIERCIDACRPDVIFHTNSSYPTKLDELNLLYINHLKEKYPTKEIGYSGHEYGVSTTIATVALGVDWIERHVTLSHDLWGSDQKASVEPVGMFKLVKGVRELETALGKNVQRREVTESEKEKLLSLRK